MHGGAPVSGESGIRTHGDISATLDFESSALDQLSHLSGKARGGACGWDYARKRGCCQALFGQCAGKYRAVDGRRGEIQRFGNCQLRADVLNLWCPHE